MRPGSTYYINIFEREPLFTLEMSCALIQTPWLLVREDSAQLVKRVLSIIKRDLPESDLIKVRRGYLSSYITYTQEETYVRFLVHPISRWIGGYAGPVHEPIPFISQCGGSHS